MLPLQSSPSVRTSYLEPSIHSSLNSTSKQQRRTPWCRSAVISCSTRFLSSPWTATYCQTSKRDVWCRSAASSPFQPLNILVLSSRLQASLQRPSKPTTFHLPRITFQPNLDARPKMRHKMSGSNSSLCSIINKIDPCRSTVVDV